MATNLDKTKAKALFVLLRNIKSPPFNLFTTAQAVAATGLTAPQLAPIVADLIARGWVTQRGTEYEVNPDQANSIQTYVIEFIYDQLIAANLLG